MSTQVTVHMIGQAHIDPIWLWPWQSGLDEVLATCRTACDLLDEYDDFIFTRGEAWSYQQIELIDPELFARIHRHIDNGRWEIVGGWWIQPDCNLPSGFGFAQQIAIGLEYLRSRFGFSPEIGYNVDSFGHAATLPGYMHDAGQRFYVMMRPQEHEKRLPARLFRWRGYVDGPEVTTFRIAGAYTTGLSLPSMEHIQRSLTELPEGITHTMCFYGVGDHGGGPTEESIRWIREHRHDLDGCELVFSSPSRFFKAIEAQMSTLPVVTGELQHHAIGCYSVQRGIKTRVRKAEHLLHQAEMMLGAEQAHEQLQTAWEQVCFNHFHDILGGTSIPSAYPQAYNQLGFAASTADTVLQQGLRKKMNALPDAPLQRTVLCNASDSLYDGYTEFEPWTQWQAWPENGVLIGEDGNELPYQLLPQESATGTIPRLLTRVTIEPGAMQTIQLGTTATPKTVLPQVTVHNTTLANMDGLSLDLGTQQGLYFPGDIALPLPRLDLISDRSDNWSHGIDRYPEGPVTSPTWDAPYLISDGPLLAAFAQTGHIGQSALRAEWRVYAGDTAIELRLRIHWAEQAKLLKMTIPFTETISHRLDGISGGSLQRENDGCERPLRDWTLLPFGEAGNFGVVCPDVFAVDVTPVRARFTLLRSPILTHHDPGLGMMPNPIYTDQGVHEFRFRFFCGRQVTEQFLDMQALMMQRPLLMADLTRGMPRRFTHPK